jgi:hypothetical protein
MMCRLQIVGALEGNTYRHFIRSTRTSSITGTSTSTGSSSTRSSAFEHITGRYLYYRTVLVLLVPPVPIPVLVLLLPLFSTKSLGCIFNHMVHIIA